MSAYTANGKRRSSMTHARRTVVCDCGKACRGNGGWSSHRRACTVFAALRAARKQAEAQRLSPQTPPAPIDAPDQA